MMMLIIISNRKLLAKYCNYKAGSDMNLGTKTLMLGREECWRNFGMKW